MGHIAATVLDAADIRAFECLLPDDQHTARVAERLAELVHLPSVGPDNYPITYGLVLKYGSAVDPQSKLGEIGLPDHPTFRIVPEFVASYETLGFSFDDPAVIEDKRTDYADVRILEERVLIEDIGLDLRQDVRIDATVHREIEEFAGRDRETECAGLLLGTVSVEGRERVTRITAAIPAVGAEGSRTSVKIDLEAWESMLLVRDKQYCDLGVLGWFHTHAGWGVFLSDPDVFIHRHFFSHPNMVAYVLDPQAGKDGFFHWHAGKIGLCPSYGLVSTVSAGRRRKENRKRQPRRGLRNIVIAMLLAAFIYVAAARPPMLDQMLSGFRSKPPTQTEKRDVRENPININVQVYALQEGESLWSVCSRFYGNGELAQSLAAYNAIDDLNRIQIGQEIRIPPQKDLEKALDR
ncbi:MAG: LysM peptidoglycan-binding domain-containing protein [Armatimonadota bacterium]